MISFWQNCENYEEQWNRNFCDRKDMWSVDAKILSARMFEPELTFMFGREFVVF